MKIINFEEIYNVLNTRKKVSNLNVSKEKFKAYINTINAINMLPEDSTWFNGADLSAYEIPEFLSGLILPEKVTIDGSRISTNLRAIENIVEDCLNHFEFNDVSQAILCALKIDSSKVAKVMRETVNVTTVLDRLIESDRVHAFSCMPIQLKVGPFHKEYYYSTQASEALVNFISDQIKSAH